MVKHLSVKHFIGLLYMKSVDKNERNNQNKKNGGEKTQGTSKIKTSKFIDSVISKNKGGKIYLKKYFKA